MNARIEAARWFAVLHRKVMTLDERATYERWLADAANKAAMAEMDRVWAILQSAAPEEGADGNAASRRTAFAVTRNVMVGVVSAISLSIVVLSFAGHSGFWTSLDWLNR
jgi:ferric-dicitrate binding protein FerR (iron transport regulator)